MRLPSDKDLQDPNSPVRYELWGRHEFDDYIQRNILIWFIQEKGLNQECLDFIIALKKSKNMDCED